ncbi:Tetratricopeptide repeat-containing protein [Pustulibacterium marinum]|uniref:Tetratricopeptide repeat-containing protein n=1 Tax=Pustulibacterium marinum TaxID=1224947 RepID=A0A1I7FEH8_9FLAO|nr:tetratricopeptide repeat protein [Pustulibacterium marinum]SFU34579.1 Tetratricopeptide repeat-containing protein [Pustulibacterium marinum]
MNKLVIVFTTFFLIGFSPVFAQLEEEPKIESPWVQAIVDSAYIAADANELDKAFHILSKAIDEHPEEKDLYYTRGSFYYYMRMFSEGEDDILKGLALPQDVTSKIKGLLLLGEVRVSYRNFKGAFTAYKEAEKLDPNHIGVLSDLANVYLETGDSKKAIELMERCLEIDKNFSLAYTNLGFTYQKLGKHKKALEYFDKSIELDPEVALTYNNRGYSELKLGMFEEALIDINKSLEMFPDNSYAYRNRAILYLELDDKVKACEDLYQALELDFTEQYGPEVRDLYKEHCSD